MGTTTGIEWTHHTFNPWRGCTKVSAGCAHCYADTLSARNPKVLGTWGKDGTRPVGSESYWRQPLAWNRAAEKAGERRRVFCLSLGDVFEDREDLVAPRARLFQLIDLTRSLDWLLLTKRPENIARLWPAWPAHPGIEAASNVWAGTSVENQATADERIPHLLRVPAAVRFLSVEPLLGPIRKLPLVGIGWVIVGCESGAHRRNQADYEAHARGVIQKCREAGVAVFHKQMPVNGRVSHDPQSWPEDLRVREFPRAAAEARA